MRRNQEDHPYQPALIVTYGNTTRKRKPLDRPLMLLGRASGCDLALVSPEVAPIHAIVVRAPDGWRVRDCTARGLTRLNGRTIQEERLNDGDVLQVGSFSFEVHLPPVANSTWIAPEQHARIQRSRRNLARLALNLRRKLNESKAGQEDDYDRRDELEALLEQRQEEMDRELRTLRTMQREFEARRLQLEEETEKLRKELAQQSQKPAKEASSAQEEQLAERARQLDLRERNLEALAERLQNLPEANNISRNGGTSQWPPVSPPERRENSAQRKVLEEQIRARLRHEWDAERRQMLEQLQQANLQMAEREHAVREAELELCRKRVQLARDRLELNRLRQDQPEVPASENVPPIEQLPPRPEEQPQLPDGWRKEDSTIRRRVPFNHFLIHERGGASKD